MAIAVTLTLSFFITGGLVIVATSFIFAAFLAAPYSILAHFIKKLDYTKKKSALMRAGIVAVFFNAVFAIIVFVMGRFIGEFLFGIELDRMMNILGGVATGYIILAVLGTVIMIFYDFSFIFAAKVLNKHLRFWKEKNDEEDKK